MALRLSAISALVAEGLSTSVRGLSNNSMRNWTSSPLTAYLRKRREKEKEEGENGWREGYRRKEDGERERCDDRMGEVREERVEKEEYKKYGAWCTNVL